MRKIFSISVLFLFSVLLYAQEGGPKLRAVEDNFDFGIITEGDIVSHEFVIYNDGSEILEIQKVRASCGCTAAKPDKDKLEPGDSTTIEVSFNSSRRKGTQRKYVYVFSNDKQTPQMRLIFSANVVDKNQGAKNYSTGPKLVLTKNQHNFGDVVEGEVVSLQVLFKNTGTDDLEISRVKSSCGCTATVLSQKSLKPGDTATLDIKLDTTGREGQFVRTVTLYSNAVNSPNQTITLYVNILDRNS